jgi:hypothetical protein
MLAAHHVAQLRGEVEHRRLGVGLETLDSWRTPFRLQGEKKARLGPGLNFKDDNDDNDDNDDK